MCVNKTIQYRHGMNVDKISNAEVVSSIHLKVGSFIFLRGSCFPHCMRRLFYYKQSHIAKNYYRR